MEQQQNPSAESGAPNAVDEQVGGSGDDGGDFTEEYFWVLLAAAMTLAAGGSLGLVYSQYDRIDRTVRSSPYVEQITQAAAAVPFLGVGEDSTEADETGPNSYGTFTELTRMVVNPAGSGGSRYLAVSVAFETNTPSVTDELSNKKIVVRDAALRLLSKRTAEELSDPSQRDDLKQALRKETNSILRSGSVDRLYFTEFVLQ